MYISCIFVLISFALGTQRKRVFSGIWTIVFDYYKHLVTGYVMQKDKLNIKKDNEVTRLHLSLHV